ncbi:MAG: HNH endonuclease signature motif containing protein [Dehalococcoidia bacterium]
MAPRRWAASTRKVIIGLIIARDGPGCRLCHRLESNLVHPLEIDHIDPDGPDDAANLRLLCKPCNLARRRPPAPRGKERGIIEREQPPKLSPTEQAKRALPYAEGSPEMKAATWFENTYRSWVSSNVPMPRSEAINGGAEAAGCSPETATRYLAKLISMAGPLTQEQNIHGVLTVRHKKEE